MKKPGTSYWIATIIFALWLVFDGLGGISHAQAGVDALRHLGYPAYLLTITGVAKLIAAIAILQNKFRSIKEWAYAGYALNCLGAFASRAFVGDSFILIIFPLIFLGLSLIPYVLWKRRERLTFI